MNCTSSDRVLTSSTSHVSKRETWAKQLQSQPIAHDTLLNSTPATQLSGCLAAKRTCWQATGLHPLQNLSQVSFAAYGLSSVRSIHQLLLLASPTSDSIQMNMLMMSCTGGTMKVVMSTRSRCGVAPQCVGARAHAPDTTRAPSLTPQSQAHSMLTMACSPQLKSALTVNHAWT